LGGGGCEGWRGGWVEYKLGIVVKTMIMKVARGQMPATVDALAMFLLSADAVVASMWDLSGWNSITREQD
jgi:hypothetical protein